MHCLSIIVLAALCGFTYSSQTACYSNGQYYKVGESFMKECNRCSCGSNGQANCTKIGCSKRERRTSEPYIEGKCYFNGQFYDDGASFKDSEDCNYCGCSILDNGQSAVYCTEMACVTLNNVNQ